MRTGKHAWVQSPAPIYELGDPPRVILLLSASVSSTVVRGQGQSLIGWRENQWIDAGRTQNRARQTTW